MEEQRNRNLDDWLESLSDAELEAIAGVNTIDERFSEWLKTLTDKELKTIRCGRPGSARILRRFDYEFKK